MAKWKVVVTRLMPEAGMKLLREHCDLRVWGEDRPIPPETLKSWVAGADGIVCLLSDPVRAELMDAAGPSLKAISTMAVGIDNIDVAEATRRGIFVGHTPGVLTEATADLTWALIMSLGRRIVEGDRLVRSGKWTGWGPMQLIGGDFLGRTLGIVGMGRIGQAVARRAAGFEMKIIYHNRRPLPTADERKFNARYAGMEELIATSDYISLHCPLNDQSRHLFNRETIGRMKPSAYLINVARGPVVDEAALVEALRAGKIAGAAFDVYEREPELSPGLTDLPNVVLAPHIGSASGQTRDRMSVMTAENLLRALRGECPEWCANPEAVKGQH
jgi:glyoxylate reductase